MKSYLTSRSDSFVSNTYRNKIRRAAERAIGKIAVPIVLLGALLIMMSLNARGQLTDAFNPNPDTTVFAVKIQPDGKIVIGGAFSTVGGQTRNRIARLNQDGTLDTTFINANANDIVYQIALQPDGKILVGGSFTSVGGQTRNRLARLNSDGTLDASFSASFTNASSPFANVRAIAVQADGKIIVGGSFNTVGGQTRNSIARLNADGTLDATFDPNAGEFSGVNAVTLQPDGKILVGGVFTNIGGANRIRIARLNADGTADATFTSPFTAAPNGRGIYAIALQPDGKIIAGGSPPVGEPIKPVARLNQDGTLDAAFNQNMQTIDGEIRTLALQANGKIIIGGIIFNTPVPFRLNADGTRDAFYNPNPDSSIFAVAVQPDQKIVVGGVFTNIGGVIRRNIARLSSESPRVAAPLFDFDGDTKADISAFRPSNGAWYIYQSATQFTPGGGLKTVQFGISTDRLAPADYDGDFKTDIAVFREGAAAYFYILQSRTNTFRAEAFGTTGDVPVPGDWDGDSKADVAVYRNGSTAGAQSYFYYRPTTAVADFRQLAWGAAGDKPVASDYDGDGKSDAAVFRPSNATWYVLRSSDNQLQAAQFGISTDRLVAADYDGDNKTDYAVYRGGTWYLQRSQLGFAAIQFGVETDVPAPADYDGDGRADTAVFRNGTWYLNRTTAGAFGGAFSAAGDKPVPGAFVQ